jgi:hypothetical protein
MRLASENPLPAVPARSRWERLPAAIELSEPLWATACSRIDRLIVSLKVSFLLSGIGVPRDLNAVLRRGADEESCPFAFADRSGSGCHRDAEASYGIRSGFQSSPPAPRGKLPQQLGLRRGPIPFVHSGWGLLEPAVYRLEHRPRLRPR